MKYYIITGASKGLGEQVVDQLLNSDCHIIGISRSGHERHRDLPNYTEMKADLSSLNDLKGIVEKAKSKMQLDKVTEIYLINNAGGIDPVGAVGSLNPEDIMRSLTLNLGAPMILSNAFVEAFKDMKVKRRILTVSSGAGKRPIFGWNAYCVGKAGVDMMTRSLGLEQGDEGIQAISFGPGIMDTDMQAQIRSQEEADFKDVEMFRGFKENGDLRKPQDVAKLLIQVLHDDTIEPGLITDVKELEK